MMTLPLKSVLVLQADEVHSWMKYKKEEESSPKMALKKM